MKIQPQEQPGALRGHQFFTDYDKLIIVSGEKQGKVTPEVWEFCQSTDEYRQICNILHARKEFIIHHVVGWCAFVIGGSDDADNLLNQVE